MDIDASCSCCAGCFWVAVLLGLVCIPATFFGFWAFPAYCLLVILLLLWFGVRAHAHS